MGTLGRRPQDHGIMSSKHIGSEQGRHHHYRHPLLSRGTGRGWGTRCFVVGLVRADSDSSWEEDVHWINGCAILRGNLDGNRGLTQKLERRKL